jgi:hypothetical protein
MRTSAQSEIRLEGGAYALIQLTNGRAEEVVETLKTLPTVCSVAAVRGPYQLIARLSVDDAAPLRQIDGVARVVTAGLVGGLSHKGARAPIRRRSRGFSISQPCGVPA